MAGREQPPANKQTTRGIGMRGKQNREPPAYQEYAATMLADARFRGASLAAKGLLYQLRLECWANRGRVPANFGLLAKFLGITENELKTTFPQIEQFFISDNATLKCPDLEDYRESLNARYEKLSAGGKKGAAVTNSTRARHSRSPSDKPKIAQTNTNQHNSLPKEELPIDHEEWIREFSAP